MISENTKLTSGGIPGRLKRPTYAGDHLELVFDGLDCLGTVWVMTALGKTDNMFIDYRFDVTGF